MDTRILFEPVWSWPMVALAAIALIVMVLVTYPPRVRHLSGGWRKTLIGMRLASAALLIFAMLRPSLQFRETDSQAAVLIVLTDSSRSMTTPDGPGGLTRREALLQTLQESEEPLKDLGEEVELRYLDFDEALKPIDTPGKEADGRFTALGKVLDDLRREDPGERVVGVVLMSDGAQRAIGDDDVDPRTAARRFAEERGIPIHTVTYGTSELSTAGLDLIVEDLLVNPVTFERKTTPVQAQVRVLGAAGRTIRVRLLLEDRTGKRPGEAGELKEIPLSSEAQPFTEIAVTENAAVIPVQLSFVPQQPGEYKLALEVVPQEGELKLTNNRLETLLTVRKGGLRVAYFDIFRPEQKFIRQLNETANIQLDWQVVLSGKIQGATHIRPEMFDPGAYDVYIIGDVPASVFQQDGVDLLSRLADRVEEGSGLVMIGGRTNFGAGGYGATRLQALLPVLTAPGEALPPGEVDPARHYKQQLQMLPAPDGLRHFVMQLSSRDNTQLWRSLPPLGGANRLQAKNEAVDILAESQDGIPLLFAHETGRGRVAAFAADDTYRWYLHGFEEVHQRFWQQLILWLARKEEDASAPVWVKVEPRNFPQGGTVPIAFGARNEQGEPISDASFEVQILSPDEESHPVTVQRAGEEGYAEFEDTDASGDYWAMVTARVNGEAVALPAMTRFIIDARDVEMDNPAADRDLMAEIASITGTASVEPEEFGDFVKGLLDEGISTDMTRISQLNLWDNWPLLLVFVLLMATEWFVRKRRGLV